MDEAKEAKALSPAGKSPGVVNWNRPKLVEYWTVKETAYVWGVSEQMVRKLIAARRIAGLRRRGKAHLLPAHRQVDGSYQVQVTPGKRGPDARNWTRVPF